MGPLFVDTLNTVTINWRLVTPPAPRVALVTGTASGLGKAAVERLQADGWRVAGLDLTGATGDWVGDVDVTSVEQVTGAVETVVRELGGLDALVHCAGVFRNDLLPVHVIDDATWEGTLRVNLTGSFNVARAALPHLVARQGVVVLVASTAADHVQPGGAAYAASKAGVRSLARSIALEYGSLGVRAISVSPGYMRTGMTEKLLSRPDILAAVEESLPLGRVSDPSEVANAIAFVVGDQSGFLTGEDITVDGGGGLMAYVGAGDVARMWERQARRGDAGPSRAPATQNPAS